MSQHQPNPPIEEVYDELMHYGTPHEGGKSHSGRYKWGSGDTPFQHGGDLLKRVEMLKAKGLSETDIAQGIGLTTTQLRTQLSLAKAEKRSELVTRAHSLRDKGYSLNEITEKMGYENNSSVRSLLNAKSEARMNAAQNAAESLKKILKETGGYLDVGTGADRELGISKEKLDQALYILEMEGYHTYGRGVSQVTNPGKQTNMKLLCPPGTEYKDIYAEGALDKFQTVGKYRIMEDANGNDTLKPRFARPSSLDSSRVMIRYAEDGGIDRDGVIEIRRGCADLDLKGSNYAQARIMVDGTHYLKGMAVYSDSKMPDGVDIIFNTNKTKDVTKMDVLKKVKDDPDNPFGALLRQDGGQYYYADKNGKEQLSPLNKTRIEGDWGEWAKALPSQFLGKQNISLVKRQLELTKTDKQAEFDEIMSLTNPTVKKALLKSFSDDCDSAAVHLKSAALPRQKYQVLLPSRTIGDNEVYAPNYKDGEYVALVRYPHGGTFEIPILKVNNKNPECQKLIGKNPVDAICISKNTADRLSGADFDGDTAMVIPTLKSSKDNRAVKNASNRVAITSTEELEGLKGFDPKMQYGGKPEGTFKVMHNTQNEMGRISNLITDMTIKGATTDELARAVRHSMVVIDAEKHKLDYKQSEKDNQIAALRKKYQYNIDPVTGKESGGASTLLSRAKSQEQVEKRKGSPLINQKGKDWYDPNRPEGALIYKSANETYTDPKTGKTKTRMITSTKMAETDDAFTLSSGTPVESEYARYANYMKDLGNQARMAMVTTGKIAYSKSAKDKYSSEVKSLDNKLTEALKNAPRERQAQVLANAVVEAKKRDNPEFASDKKAVKKLAQQELTKARDRFGAHRTKVTITPKEWEAIQAGAISENQLSKILNNADMDDVRKYATPRNTKGLTDAQISMAKARKAAGYTMEQIADQMGVSVSTISKYTKG